MPSATVPEGVPKRVATLRELSGKSRYHLSRIAGLSPSHVGQLERGLRESPTAETLGRLARACGVSLDWLLSGTGKAPTERSVREALANAEARP